MTFQRNALSFEKKHQYLLEIYEKTRNHCENFEKIYQYLKKEECDPEIIEEIYTTTEKLSQQWHKKQLTQHQEKTRALLEQIHQKELTEKEQTDDLLSQLNNI